MLLCLFILGQCLAALDSMRGFYFISFSNHRHCLTPLKPITLQIWPHGPNFWQSLYMPWFCWTLDHFHCFRGRGFWKCGPTSSSFWGWLPSQEGKEVLQRVDLITDYAWKASGRQAEAWQKSTCPCYFSSFTRLCSTGRAKEHHVWKSHGRELPFLPKAQLLMAYLTNQTLTEQEPHPRITSNAERIMKSRDKTQDIGKTMICPRHGHQVAQNPASSKLSKKLKVRKQDFPLNFLAATAVAPCEAIKTCG